MFWSASDRDSLMRNLMDDRSCLRGSMEGGGVAGRGEIGEGDEGASWICEVVSGKLHSLGRV